MSYLDLKTGELYQFILYEDADCVILWTDGRESLIDKAAFDSAEILSSEDENAASFAADRFQAVGPFDVELPLQCAERQTAIHTYAATNGGQIIVHQSDDRKTGFLAVAGRKWRDLFA